MSSEEAIQENSVVVRSTQPSVAMVDGEAIMMSLTKGTYCSLNQVGTRIWELLAAPVSVADLCRKLRDEFDVEPAECQQAVLDFLNRLQQQDVVELASVQR